jgi:hypothetical protein
MLQMGVTMIKINKIKSAVESVDIIAVFHDWLLPGQYEVTISVNCKMLMEKSFFFIAGHEWWVILVIPDIHRYWYKLYFILLTRYVSD